MLTDDVTIIRDIKNYVGFVRGAGLKLSITFVDRKLKLLYPSFGVIEYHHCSLCNFVKSQDTRTCYYNKNRLVGKRLREPVYAVCPYGVEEFIRPVVYEGTTIAYLHVTGYRGKLARSEKFFRFHERELPEAYAREYAALDTATPSEDYLESALAPLMYMLIEFYLGFVRDRVPLGGYDLVNSKILGYVYENYSTPFNIPDIAAALGYSESHIRFVFKQKNGTSLAAFVTDFKLSQAKIKLRTTDESVSRIALESGFSDPNHFSSLFRRKFGMTPVAYRNSDKSRD